VSHSAVGIVSVIDGSDNTVIDTINMGVNPNYSFAFPGIAVNPATNTIYVTYDEGSVSIIDGSDNNVIDTINLGVDPNYYFIFPGIAVNPATNTIYVANSQGSSISVIVLDSKPPVKETPQESAIEETLEKEPLQGIEEFVEQIDDTLGDQVSLEVNEEPIQMVEESLQGIAEFILEAGTETSKEIVETGTEIGQSAIEKLNETKQFVDQERLEAKEIVEEKGSEAIQEIGEIIPEDNQMMYVGIGVIIFIIIIAGIAVAKRKKSQPEDL
jgi:hypothetical protein